MTRVRDLISSLDLGKSVAEFDDSLERYFIETSAFRELINGKIDIVAGDKGTGKTAIYRILQKQYAGIPALAQVEVLPAFNLSGNPIFQKLGEHETQGEGEYIRLWKLYFLSLAGNWLLGVWEDNFTSDMAELDSLLRGLDVREKDDVPVRIFSKILSNIGSLFHWKSAAVQITASESGIPIVTPKIEFDKSAASDNAKQQVNVESAFALLNSCLVEAGVTVWIAVDRLDEAFQGFPAVEVPALRALLRTYLDILEFSNVKLKLFLRRDLFRRIILGGFVNLTHVNARKFEIIWDEEDLLNLLVRRIRENGEFCKLLSIDDENNEGIFYKVFPNQVDVGKRKPRTWTWIMRRIRDGNDIKPPRNLIDLISMAQQAQVRREERDSREFLQGVSPIEGDSLRRALTQLSSQRVQDTLLAEAGSNAALIDRFRDGKAEHNTESLANLLEVEPGAVRSAVQPLMDIGFLEDVKDTYKVPALYREGLKITQGKAFEMKSGSTPAEDEDEDE